MKISIGYKHLIFFICQGIFILKEQKNISNRLRKLILPKSISNPYQKMDNDPIIATKNNRKIHSKDK